MGGIISGTRDTIRYYNVQLYIEDNWIISIMAGFLKKLSVPGILGRNGFFDNFKVIFEHVLSPPEFEIERSNKPI